MIGTKLAHYEITSHIGSGGMGDVYQATDTKLGRSVAIKCLPEAFSHDTERVARFQREARLLASLNHSNIAAVHGLEEINSRYFLVMELVAGETLADRIKRGAIPIEEALPIAKQIAEALEEAHEKGIIHRDLKPANIKLTPDGKVKVLDFGLAKAYEREQANAALSNSPTISMAATNAGLILGTAAYMSPEQAKGKEADPSWDVWAFGCVLYETLTGQPAFEGETATEILGGVLKTEPNWNCLPEETPAGIRRVLRRCLQKNRTRRFHDMADVRIEIEEAQSGAEAERDVPHAPAQRRSKVFLGVMAVLFFTSIGSLAALSVLYFKWPQPAEIRVEVSTPPTFDPSSLAISPDGRRLVFSAWTEGKPQLWVRPLDSFAAQPLPGTDGASHPFWSPDSASVGFFADSKLKRIDIVDGARQVLANATNGQGGTWSREGTIVFAPTAQGGLFKVPARGGESVPVTRPDTQEFHLGPEFLPDGSHFVYLLQGGSAPGIYAGSLDGTSPKRLASADSKAVVSPTGFLFFLRQTTIFAQSFDFKRQELSGNPFPVVGQVGVGAFGGGFSAAAGIVAYRSGSASLSRQLKWLDRSGKTVGTVGGPDIADVQDLELAPDGKRVALSRTGNGNRDVWLVDVARGESTRFTFNAAADQGATWAPDGNRVVFASNRKRTYNLYWKLSSGAGPEELLLESDLTKVPNDWSSDGRFLLFRNTDPQTGYDLWVLPTSGENRTFPFLKTPFAELNGRFSPDGKWITYQSNESGQFEIYVQPFPGPGGKFQISTGGGTQPRWNKNGKEIFYVSLDSKIMAAGVKLSPDSQSLETGTAVALFPVRIASGLPGISRWQYAVSSDGQRFVVNVAADEGTTSPITLIYNWHPPAK
jgi:eukaryotic-like serine/threonine-protein kinase